MLAAAAAAAATMPRQRHEMARWETNEKWGFPIRRGSYYLSPGFASWPALCDDDARLIVRTAAD
jgi:hypothetical protein